MLETSTKEGQFKRRHFLILVLQFTLKTMQMKTLQQNLINRREITSQSFFILLTYNYTYSLVLTLSLHLLVFHSSESFVIVTLKCMQNKSLRKAGSGWAYRGSQFSQIGNGGEGTVAIGISKTLRFFYILSCLSRTSD